MRKTPHKPALYGDMIRWGLIHADALLMLAKLPDRCVEAIVTDPPYGIDFVGAAWDGADIRRRAGNDVGSSEAFERWSCLWASEARRVLIPGGHLLAFGAPRTFHRLTAGIEDAGFEVRDMLTWLFAQGLPKSKRLPGGRGLTLKPAYEPILLARSPFEGSTDVNLQRWGTGALNIDETRVGENRYWPAHLSFSHSSSCTSRRCASDCPAGMIDAGRPADRLPSRLFFCAKASRSEREIGCEHLPQRAVALYTGKARLPRMVRNVHPTVKPIALMRWLVRLVTPPEGLVLDPFAGSGSTGIAALLESRRFIGIEREASYIDVACGRLTHWAHQASRAAT
jgi:DNA modification methylase